MSAAVGRGGIGPMSERWRALLARHDEEKPRLQQLKAQAQDTASPRSGDRPSDVDSHPLR